MTRSLLVLVVLAACGGGHQESEKPAAHPPAVPGIETVVAAEEVLRDVVRAFGAVTAEAEPAEVRDARAQLVETEARHRLATEQVRRLEALSKGAVAPRKELEAARAELAAAEATADKTRKAFAAFGADAARAPLGPDEIWAIAQVAQSDVARVAPKAEARVAADAFSGRVFTGTVDAAPPYVDPGTRLAPVRIRVRDPERALRPGMTGAVLIEVGELHPAVVVPLAAVVYDGAQPVVFVAEAEGRFVPRPVELGVVRDGRIAVSTGLEAGARVATTGAASLLSAARLSATGEEPE